MAEFAMYAKTNAHIAKGAMYAPPGEIVEN
jgi:hypothetical protein